MKIRAQYGFTLYELLITLLLIGVVLAIGVPNLGDLTRNSRVTGTVNDLHGSIMLARSEAARAKENVTLCASADPAGAALCDGDSFDDGWIVFVDLNGDLERAGTGENVLKVFPPVSNALDILPINGATYFSFGPNGLGRGDVGGRPALRIAYICDERGNRLAAGGLSAARALVVTPTGRSTVVRDTAQIDALAGDAC